MRQLVPIVLLGAFLLFTVQPIVGRILLPVCGGAASVWTVCVLVFQWGLALGYGYAHALARFPRPQAARLAHLLAVIGSLACLPISAHPSSTNGATAPPGGDAPTWWIVSQISIAVGAPFVVLSATMPLLGYWSTSTKATHRPYRLYAASNLGSLLGMLVYATGMDAWLGLQEQSRAWSWMYGVYCLTLVLAVWSFRKGPSPEVRSRSTLPLLESRLAWREWLSWSIRAACGSVLLLSTTNQICQEVAVIPFLWVAPLAIYLLTFIIFFSNPTRYRPRWYNLGLAAIAIPQCAVLYIGARIPLGIQLVVYLTTLSLGCSVCHGGLALSTPSRQRQSTFYLCIAIGGALGGTFVALIAPAILNGYWEFHLAFFGVCVLGSGLLGFTASGRASESGMRSPGRLDIPALSGLVALGLILAGEIYYGQLDALETRRTFYGILRVVEGRDEHGAFRQLGHGRIAHGMQYEDAALRRQATLYFRDSSAVAKAIKWKAQENAGGLHIGIVGLGVGTLAAYGREGDRYRFYEINPEVETLARRYFSYLEDSAATIHVIPGDARVRLEEERQAGRLQQFDLLILDAFRNDAIPIHLLTAECLDVYLAHLRTDGLLVMHVSNRFLDLIPVVRGLAHQHRLTMTIAGESRDAGAGSAASEWIVLDRDGRFPVEPGNIRESPASLASGEEKKIVWTDDWHAIWSVLRPLRPPATP